MRPPLFCAINATRILFLTHLQNFNAHSIGGVPMPDTVTRGEAQLSPQTIAAVLQSARWIITPEHFFTTREFARNRFGFPVNPTSKQARKFDLLGAISVALAQRKIADHAPDGENVFLVAITFADVAEIPHEDPVPAPLVLRVPRTWCAREKRVKIRGAGRVADWGNKTPHAEILETLDRVIATLSGGN